MLNFKLGIIHFTISVNRICSLQDAIQIKNSSLRFARRLLLFNYELFGVITAYLLFFKREQHIFYAELRKICTNAY